VVFLQQGMGMRQRRRSNGIWDLPQGWESVGMVTSPKAFDTNRKSQSSLGLEPELDVKKQSPESKPSTEHFTDLISISTMRQIRDDQVFFYQERHTDSITLKRPRVSIVEDRRLSLGFQAITGARKVVGSENQVYGLDLIPFFNRNASENIDDSVSSVPGNKDVSTMGGVLLESTFQLCNEPMYGDDWYSTDVLRLQSTVVEPSLAGLFRVCLSPIYNKFARILPTFSSLFPDRFEVSRSVLAIEIVLESLLKLAVVVTVRRTFTRLLEYLTSRLKLFMQLVFYGCLKLCFRLLKRLYPFPDFAALFRALLQRVVNNFWLVSIPVVLLWLLFWVYFCLFLVGLAFAPLYDRLARYAIAVLDFVEGFEDFLDPDSRNFWFSWLSWFFQSSSGYLHFWFSWLLR
jgi:hypothetical protein